MELVDPFEEERRRRADLLARRAAAARKSVNAILDRGDAVQRRSILEPLAEHLRALLGRRRLEQRQRRVEELREREWADLELMPTARQVWMDQGVDTPQRVRTAWRLLSTLRQLAGPDAEIDAATFEQPVGNLGLVVLRLTEKISGPDQAEALLDLEASGACLLRDDVREALLHLVLHETPEWSGRLLASDFPAWDSWTVAGRIRDGEIFTAAAFDVIVNLRPALVENFVKSYPQLAREISASDHRAHLLYKAFHDPGKVPDADLRTLGWHSEIERRAVATEVAQKLTPQKYWKGFAAGLSAEKVAELFRRLYDATPEEERDVLDQLNRLDATAVIPETLMHDPSTWELVVRKAREASFATAERFPQSAFANWFCLRVVYEAVMTNERAALVPVARIVDMKGVSSGLRAEFFTARAYLNARAGLAKESLTDARSAHAFGRTVVTERNLEILKSGREKDGLSPYLVLGLPHAKKEWFETWTGVFGRVWRDPLVREVNWARAALEGTVDRGREWFVFPVRPLTYELSVPASSGVLGGHVVPMPVRQELDDEYIDMLRDAAVQEIADRVRNTEATDPVVVLHDGGQGRK